MTFYCQNKIFPNTIQIPPQLNPPLSNLPAVKSSRIVPASVEESSPIPETSPSLQSRSIQQRSPQSRSEQEYLAYENKVTDGRIDYIINLYNPVLKKVTLDNTEAVRPMVHFLSLLRFREHQLLISHIEYYQEYYKNMDIFTQINLLEAYMKLDDSLELCIPYLSKYSPAYFYRALCIVELPHILDTLTRAIAANSHSRIKNITATIHPRELHNFQGMYDIHLLGIAVELGYPTSTIRELAKLEFDWHHKYLLSLESLEKSTAAQTIQQRKRNMGRPSKNEDLTDSQKIIISNWELLVELGVISRKDSSNGYLFPQNTYGTHNSSMYVDNFINSGLLKWNK